MPLANLLVQPVTIKTAAKVTDRYSDTVLDWTTTTDTPERAWLDQIATREVLDHRDETNTTALATFAVTSAITAQARVVADGITYEVIGEPRLVKTPRGPHHVEVDLKAIVG